MCCNKACVTTQKQSDQSKLSSGPETQHTFKPRLRWQNQAKEPRGKGGQLDCFLSSAYLQGQTVVHARARPCMCGCALLPSWCDCQAFHSALLMLLSPGKLRTLSKCVVFTFAESGSTARLEVTTMTAHKLVFLNVDVDRKLWAKTAGTHLVMKVPKQAKDVWMAQVCLDFHLSPQLVLNIGLHQL